MRLRRVQVPDFRVLKDVDIEFETDFVPQVFPLGSQNGGGKSTLLQLIFVLLHCSTKANRSVFLRNVVENFKVFNQSSTRPLAIIDILDKNRTVQLEFFVCNDLYIHELIDQENTNNSTDELNSNELSISVFLKLITAGERLSKAEKERSQWKEVFKELKDIGSTSDPREKQRRLIRLFRDFRMLSQEYEIVEIDQFNRLQKQVEQRLEVVANNYIEAGAEHTYLLSISHKIINLLAKQNITYLLAYLGDDNEGENTALLCRTQGIEIKEVKPFLNTLSEKVFLAAPSTQIFLFLSRAARKLLFKEQKSVYTDETYYHHMQRAKEKLTGLFAYDVLAVDLLIDSFKKARDRDFEEAVERGEYGTHYKTLLNSLNSMLSNKKLTLRSDLSGVTFKIGRGEQEIELYPEDLSHGELKRLSIYMWLIHHNIQDAIVLMDEIEIALHPDWQYRIVSDLIEWSPTNQYVLATHSYELCQALTPAHVKELEPRLLKPVEQLA